MLLLGDQNNLVSTEMTDAVLLLRISDVNSDLSSLASEVMCNKSL